MSHTQLPMTAVAAPSIWSLMSEEARVRMYRLAADGEADTEVLRMVAKDCQQRVEIREMEARK